MTFGSGTIRLAGFSIRYHRRTLLVGCILAAVLAVLAILLLGTGTLAIAPQDVIAIMTGRDADPVAGRVLTRIRLPRVLTAILVGSALGMAGAIFQSISRNPLGSPDVVGFTTGAATGAITQIILYNAGPFAVSLAAIASGCATAAVVFLLSRRQGGSNAYRLVLIGIGVGATLSGLNTIFLVMGDLDQAAAAHVWLAGSLNTRTWSHVAVAAGGLLLLAPFAFSQVRTANMLEMGDDTAQQLGISVERSRIMMMLNAVCLTAIATAAAGPIAFIALAAPQIARGLTAHAGVPLISGGLSGAVLLLSADLLSQNLPFAINMPIGLTTGLMGGAYLLWLLQRR